MDLLEQNELEELGAAGVSAISKIARGIFGEPGHRTSEKQASAELSPKIPVPTDYGAIEKRACALELLRLNVVTPAQALSLGKFANVTLEHARRSLDRLDSLERNKPTVGQAARYGALGAAGGAAIGAIGNAIEHGTALKGATPKAKALNLAANAVKGSLGGGAIPLARASLDRRAELGTLRRFMHETPTEG